MEKIREDESLIIISVSQNKLVVYSVSRTAIYRRQLEMDAMGI